jgi:hypothetical protein
MIIFHFGVVFIELHGINGVSLERTFPLIVTCRPIRRPTN